jgi:hypothetical protein
VCNRETLSVRSSSLLCCTRCILREFPDLDLSVWYLDDGTIIGHKDDVFKVFELLRTEGPKIGLHLNVKKNEIWWPSRGETDPFPAEVTRC